MSLTAAVVFYTSSGIDPMLLCFDRHLTTEKQQAKKIKVVLLWTLCSWSVSGWNVHKKALSHTVLFLYFFLTMGYYNRHLHVCEASAFCVKGMN